MKKIYSALFFTFLFYAATPVIAQDAPRVRNANENEYDTVIVQKGFKKENLFTGGGFTLGFGSGYTALGISPMLGYKLNDYFDAGFLINYLYIGQRDMYNNKISQSTYGPGIFARAYPIPFLFAQTQLEHNFVHIKSGRKGDPYYLNQKTNATSLLLGAGYAGGRNKGGTTFYSIALLFDVLKNINSPYVDVTNRGTADEKVHMRPIFNATFNIGLFQKRDRIGY